MTRLRQTVSSQSMSGSPMGSFLLSRRHTSTRSPWLGPSFLTTNHRSVSCRSLPIVSQSPIACRIINEYSWLPDKEEEVIAVDAPVWLEEEVSDKQICPVGSVPAAREPGVLTTNQRSVLRLHGPIRGQYSIGCVPGPARGCKMVSSVNL